MPERDKLDDPSLQTEFPGEKQLPPAEQIIAMLKSADPEQKTAAMDMLFPGESTVLVRLQGNAVTLASGSEPDHHRLFSALQWATCLLGAIIGMELHWVPDQKDAGRKLVVPGSGEMPMIR